MMVPIRYIAGLLLLSVVFLLPMTFLAGIARVSLFHFLSRHRDKRVEPSTVIGLNKRQMEILFFFFGYVLLAGIYSLLFFHFA